MAYVTPMTSFLVSTRKHEDIRHHINLRYSFAFRRLLGRSVRVVGRLHTYRIPSITELLGMLDIRSPDVSAVIKRMSRYPPHPAVQYSKLQGTLDLMIIGKEVIEEAVAQIHD